MCLSKLILNLIISASSKCTALKPMLNAAGFFWNRLENYHILWGRHSETLRWAGKREMPVVSPNAMLCFSRDLCLSFGWWPLADKPWSGKVCSHTSRENIDEHLSWCTRRPFSLTGSSCCESMTDGMWLELGADGLKPRGIDRTLEGERHIKSSV